MSIFMKLIFGLFSGMLAWIFSRYLVSALITGTTSSDTIFTAAIPLAIGVFVIVVAISSIGATISKVKGG